MSSRNGKGITLTDLIVGAALCVILMVAMVPAAGVLDDARNKAACAHNLKLIAAAMSTYSNDNNGKYPRTTRDYEHPDNLVAYTSVKCTNPFDEKNGMQVNDVTAGLYLLIRVEKLDPAVFICPSTKAKALTFGKGAGAIAEKTTDISNFPSGDYLSYSGSCPFPGRIALTTQWVWDSTITTDGPLVSDMNPGSDAVLHVTARSTAAELAKANSLNHGGTGQNVLYGDYHVEFTTTPFCGIKDDTGARDNIFSRSTVQHAIHNAGDKPGKEDLKGDPIFGPPTDAYDSVMLPTANYKAAKAK
ncbi:MAG TPA: hypothetical protein VFE47_30850 [Tepidisphaeraceae bacterium]|jgi:competence protein ComGC|nr:hypothetical protein [Tepidisphaeraceae bacterium]